MKFDHFLDEYVNKLSEALLHTKVSNINRALIQIEKTIL